MFLMNRITESNKNNNNNNNNHTVEANKIIPLHNNIIYCRETMNVDGYDRYGPKSNLWYFYVIVENEGDYECYNYCWENWFRKNTEKRYEFCNMFKLSKTTLKKRVDLFNVVTPDDNYNNAVQKHIESLNLTLCKF